MSTATDLQFEVQLFITLHDNFTRIEHKCITKVLDLHRPQLTAHSLLLALFLLASKSPKALKAAFTSLHTVGADLVIDPLAVEPPVLLPISKQIKVSLVCKHASNE
jgi:hypothetical protein